MKKAWILLADRFDALKPRERVAVFVALAAMLVGLFFVLVFNPAFARYQRAHVSLQQSEQGLAAAGMAELALLQGASVDPDAGLRQLIASQQDDNAALRSRLERAQAQLASPDRMTGMLRELIAAQKDVDLLALRSEPVEDLLAQLADGTQPRAAAGRSLYRHGIELRVRGNYQALAAYLRKIENLPWKIRLAKMSLKTDKYPQATLTLNLYTLSLERAWLMF